MPATAQMIAVILPPVSTPSSRARPVKPVTSAGSCAGTARPSGSGLAAAGVLAAGRNVSRCEAGARFGRVGASDALRR